MPNNADTTTKTPIETNSDLIAEVQSLVDNLPEAGGTDISLGVTGASVGDIVKVKAVDENGKPTEWEAADGSKFGDSIFTGKTASFYGDSLTEENYHYTKGYHQWISEILGLASYNNYGVSGYKISDVISKVNSVTDTADIIFVMAGVNDRQFDVPLGTLAEMADGTVYGNLNTLCNTLRSKYSTKLLVFLTPAEQTKYPGTIGVSMYDIAKAIKEVCERYSIVVYDNFIFSEINSSNLSYWTTDNCHWNNKAHEMAGKNIARFIANTFQYLHGASEGGVTLSIVSDSIDSATYSDGTLTFTGLKQVFGGIIFEGANEVTINIDDNDFSTAYGFGWLAARDGNVFHAIGIAHSLKTEAYDFNSSLTNASAVSITPVQFPTTGNMTMKIENDSVNFYFNNILAHSLSGDAIGYITSNLKPLVLHGVTVV